MALFVPTRSIKEGLVYQLASSQTGDNTPIKSLTTPHIAVGLIDGLMI